VADRFCSECGKRLAGAGKFCENCGSPVVGQTAGKSVQLKGAELFKSMGLKIRPIRGSEEDTDELKDVQGVHDFCLDDILNCSFMNAPLNTDFLLVENPQQDRWVTPLVWLDGMRDLKVVCGMTVYYYLDTGFCSPSLDECDRSDLPEDVAEAYRRALNEPCIQMYVHPSFQPRKYTDFDDEFTGRWRTYRAQEGRYEVITIVPLPPSGRIMKGRLREHEAFISKWIATERDPSAKRTLEKLRDSVAAAIQVIPDGVADHIVCEARQLNVSQTQSLCLYAEEDVPEDEEGRETVEKSLAFCKTSRLKAAIEPPVLKSADGKSLNRRPEGSRSGAVQPFWRR
jgi:hypothetical protein